MELVSATMQHSCWLTSGVVLVSGLWAGSVRFHAMRLVEGWAGGSPAGTGAGSAFAVQRCSFRSARHVWN
eukprot:3400869-Alexandrium_andersonii.AAC.1